MNPALLGGIGSIIGGLGGIFGSKKPEKIDIADNIRDQAWGARQAAEKFGFNPLTMLQHGQPGGAGYTAGNPAPLASIAMLTEGLKDVSDVTSGDHARRRAADELELDLARVKLDQARSGVVATAAPVASGAYGVGGGLPAFGRNAVAVPTSGGAVFSNKLGMQQNPHAPGRAKEAAPVVNSAGVFELDNAYTHGPVTIPGEGEPWGWDEAATAVLFGAPQVALNYGKKVIKDVADSRDDTWEERKTKARKAAKDHVFSEPPGIAGMFSRAAKFYR